MWTRAIQSSPPGCPADLIAWRRRQLVQAGFDPRTAGVFAESAIDLHATIELVEAGCPPPMAARIMAPLDFEPTER